VFIDVGMDREIVGEKLTDFVIAMRNEEAIANFTERRCMAKRLLLCLSAGRNDKAVNN
jgi:hypothetical protein